MYATGGAITINSSTISGNHAHDGAGIYSGGATNNVGLRSRVTIANSTFEQNEAHASGGGLLNGGDAQLILTDITFADNKAGDEGAGLVNNGFASTDATRVTFSGQHCPRRRRRRLDRQHPSFDDSRFNFYG
ncbi:hypothetical protein HC776_01715 [bacterium]|nr:hypothetical protein [bacterium]